MPPTRTSILLATIACALVPACLDSSPPELGSATQDSYIPVGPLVWQGGVVRYHLSAAFTNMPGAQAAFDDTVREYEQTTGLTFVEQTDLTQPTVFYDKWPAPCYGGLQTLQDPNDPTSPLVLICPTAVNRQTVLHETGHALGMLHEQERPDAPRFVQCFRDNIDVFSECCDSKTGLCDPDCVANPCTVPDGPLSPDPGPKQALSPFDYTSTMMYGSLSFSFNDKPVLTTTGAGTCVEPGGSEPGACIPDHTGDLSVEDINALRQLYELPLDGDVDGMQFGFSLASGDFDHDGYMDLAVGAPARAGAAGAVGAVYLFKGTWGIHQIQLAGPSAPVWMTELVPWKKLTPESLGQTGQNNEQFGFALEAGDFDGDGIDDLAIGAPGRNSSTGAIYLAYGHPYVQPGDVLPDPVIDGLTATSSVASGAASYYQRSALGGGAGNGNPGDRFGATLARGVFLGSAARQLAIGAPGRGAGDVLVTLLTSPTAGLRTLQDVPSPGTTGSGQFGAAIAMGDLDGDGFTDMVVGAPTGAASGGGAVMVYLWSGSALTRRETVASTLPSDAFGTAVAMAKFRGNAQGVAIGIPGRTSGQGVIQLREWDGTKLAAIQTVDQTIAGGTNGANDRFGEKLHAAHLHGSAHADLIVGVPHKKLAGLVDAGCGYVLRGDSTGFTGGSSHHATTVQAHGLWGSAVIGGDFDNDSNEDAAFGASGTSLRRDSVNAGILTSFQGTPTGLTGGNWMLAAAYENIIP